MTVNSRSRSHSLQFAVSVQTDPAKSLKPLQLYKNRAQSLHFTDYNSHLTILP
jgi:hypothetical protein